MNPVDSTALPQALCSPFDFYNEIAYHFINEESITSFPEPVVNAFTWHEYRDIHYHKFEIPKKSGGVRTIMAPTGKLKSLQAFLAGFLTPYYVPRDSVHGFVPGRSVLTNAEQHIRMNYVLNIDLKDFFTSITSSMVSEGLRKIGVDKKVAGIIAAICTRMDTSGDDLPMEALPQGAPTSPILSNFACTSMDARLEGLASRFGLTYTRYADDITFSSYHSVYAKDSEFWKELKYIISQSGFTINEAKTRLLKRGSRQEVTGITVCEKPNVSRRWLKNLRAAIYHAEMYGYRSEKEYLSVKGKLAYLKMVRGCDMLYEKLYLRALYAHRSIPLLKQHEWYPRLISCTVPDFNCLIRIGYETEFTASDYEDLDAFSYDNPFE